MRIATFSFLAFLFLFLPVSNAGDGLPVKMVLKWAAFPHLTPGDDVLSEPQFIVDYHLLVRKILYAGLSRYPYFRMTVLPSFGPEWVVEIQNPVGDVATVKYAIVDGKIRDNDAPEELQVIERSTRISSDLVQLLGQLLDKHMDGVRYAYADLGSVGVDGTTYHFSDFSRGWVRTGQTWSPKPQWPTGRLVIVTGLLRELTLAPQDQVRKLENQIRFVAKAALADLSDK
jgi:hypothetical protein